MLTWRVRMMMVQVVRIQAFVRQVLALRRMQELKGRRDAARRAVQDKARSALHSPLPAWLPLIGRCLPTCGD